jgi:hypothetical protein
MVRAKPTCTALSERREGGKKGGREGGKEEKRSCVRMRFSGVYAPLSSLSLPPSLPPSLPYLPDRRQKGHGLSGCFLHHYRAEGLQEEDDRSSSSSSFREPGKGGGRDEVEELRKGGREGGREGMLSR